VLNSVTVECSKVWYTRHSLLPESTRVNTATIIVGHCNPDLDCLSAMWILRRWGGLKEALLRFVPAGTTLDGAVVDSDPRVIHVDTGHGRFDHHDIADPTLSAAELVRRVVAPDDAILQRMTHAITQLDHARAEGGTAPNICDLISGFNMLHPTSPETVAVAVFANLDAWYAYEARQLNLEAAFAARIEFDTPWGLGIAMESDDGGSARLAYGAGAVLYVYRDGKGNMGVVARSRSPVDLTPICFDLKRIDPNADWYLHPSKRMLVCGTPKAPPRVPSRLSLSEVVGVLRGDYLF
jgi:hypothetical protein